MKLIKKIAAIMFAFMMVVSLSCNVKAAGTGKITISPVNPNEEYKIYKILKLESYDETKQLYSYTKTGDQWDAFIDLAVTDGYLKINTDGYVTFSTTKNSEADIREFAKKALAYAKETHIAETQTVNTNANDTSATVDGLELGYYLVGSSMGALCSLDTTHTEATIKDKNEKPTVEKKIIQGEQLVDKNSANIGEEVFFQTTINVKKGAKNYVLHDTMDSHLTYGGILQVHDNLHNLADTTDFIVKSELTDGCTFEISFTDAYYAKNREDIDTGNLNKITVQYGAYVKEDAKINEPMKNTTHLTYGDNNTETNKPETTTKTFEMNVFKFYKDKNDSTTEKGLDGATFKLTKDSQDAENISFVKTSNETATDDVYRVAKTGETGTVTTITSPESGKFKIQGLGAGTYYLTETKQPAGYNKLKNPVTVVIDNDGNVKVGESEANPVKVENKTGTVLPSTGGAGTTMIYLIGGALVLGSGVVLATKRRVKGK